MKRRNLVLGAGAAGIAAFTGTVTFRWHAKPRRQPYLTDQHLNMLGDLPPSDAHRVLFVGNSMTLRNNLPQLVASSAANAGFQLQVATAAARGVRLIEAWKLDALRDTLRAGWDTLVLQDFSTTCLRATDRWGSAYAMRAMAESADHPNVVLFPTWAFPQGHHVYQSGAGLFSSVPDNPAAFAACITAHYEDVSGTNGWVRAPVTEAFQPDPRRWLEDDLHHPNKEGSMKIAQILWQSMRPMVEARSSQSDT